MGSTGRLPERLFRVSWCLRLSGCPKASERLPEPHRKRRSRCRSRTTGGGSDQHRLSRCQGWRTTKTGCSLWSHARRDQRKKNPRNVVRGFYSLLHVVFCQFKQDRKRECSQGKQDHIVTPLCKDTNSGDKSDIHIQKGGKLSGVLCRSGEFYKGVFVHGITSI